MNDSELDQLITETLERDKMLKTINKNILSHLQKNRRHTIIGKITKMIAIAFGCPLLFAIYYWYYWTTYSDTTHSNISPIAHGFIGLTVVILFFSLTAFITKIHAEDL